MIRITDVSRSISQAIHEAETKEATENSKATAEQTVRGSEDSSGYNLLGPVLRSVENALGSVARQAQLGGAKTLPAVTKKTATQEQVLDGAKKAGLSDDEVNELKSVLDQFKELNPAMHQRELQFLNDKVIQSPNARAGLQTYSKLHSMSDRTTTAFSNHIHDLTVAVTEPREKGGTGILSPDEAVNAARAFNDLTLDQSVSFKNALESAGKRNGHVLPGADPEAEKACLWKALAQRSDRIADQRANNYSPLHDPMSEITQYADEIRGMPRAQLVRGDQANLTTQDVLRGARGAGLNSDEIEQLKKRLGQIGDKASLDFDLKFLNSHVLNTPNAANGLRTYLKLKDLSEQPGGETISRGVYQLTQAVAEARSSSIGKNSGIMTPREALTAAKTIMNMDENEQMKFNDILGSAGIRNGKIPTGADPDAERAYIWKALAERSDRFPHGVFESESGALNEIRGYADQIRGMQREELIKLDKREWVL